MHLRLIALSLAGALFTLPLHAADDAKPPLERLKAAADLTALDGSGLRPWHWLLNISVFDKEGKNPKAGTLEMWSSNGNMRSVESLGGKQITTLRIGDNLYRTAGDEKDVADISLIEMELLHPIPNEAIQAGAAVKVMQESVGAVKLDCMTPAVGQPSGDAAAGAQAVSFCFEQDGSKMLVTQEPGNFSILRPRSGLFQGHQVPVDLQTFAGAVMLSEAKTTKLATEPVDASLFQVQPNMGPVNAPLAVAASDLRGFVLSKTPPVYPPELKQKHVAGAVILDATIGKDGHIASLKEVVPSVAQLIGPAKDAVNHWLFRPYMLNGLPVEVKTQLTMTFGGGGPQGPPHDPADDAPMKGSRGR